MVLTNIRYSIVRRRSSCQGATRELVRRRKERIEILGRQIYKLQLTAAICPLLQKRSHHRVAKKWPLTPPLLVGLWMASDFFIHTRRKSWRSPVQKSDIHGFCATGGGDAAQAKPVKAEPPKLLSGRAPLAWVLLGFTINLRCDRHRCKKCGKIRTSFFSWIATVSFWLCASK